MMQSKSDATTHSYQLQEVSLISPLLVEQKKHLEKIFNISIEKIQVMILQKDAFSPLKRNDWEIAFTYPRRNIIFTMSCLDCNRSYEEWIKVIIHEMVHIFYVAKFRTYEPIWLFEGLACYLAGQTYPQMPTTPAQAIKYHSISDKDVYCIGYNLVSKMFLEGSDDEA